MCKLNDLHDASLRSVAVDVDASTAVLVFEPVSGVDKPEQVRLIAHGWRTLSLPKREPWGHSAVWYVNEARGPWTLASGLKRVEIEMQSGDILEIEAARLERSDVGCGERPAG